MVAYKHSFICNYFFKDYIGDSFKMFEINNNVVFVKGYVRGAIYNLNNGDVYSVNESGVKIINEYISNGIKNVYLEELKKEGLLSFEYDIHSYVPTNAKKDINTIWFELTQNCNMKCLHCYEGEIHKASLDILTLDDWESIIVQLRNTGVKNVILIGGEPTLYSNIKEILLLLNKEKIKTTLFTNTYNINDDLLSVIVATRCAVKVSLYGVTSEVHDSITGRFGSFDKLIGTVKILAKNGIDVNIAITIMKENEHQKDLFKDFLNNLPINGYKIDMIRKVDGCKQNLHYPQLTSTIRDWQRKKPNFYATKEMFDRNYTYNSCWFGKMVITEIGDILPCVFARNIILGNIRNQTLKEVLKDGGCLDKLWKNNLDKIDDCCCCEYRYACIDCRPLAEAVNGKHKKNPRCLYNPKKGEWSNEDE